MVGTTTTRGGRPASGCEGYVAFSLLIDPVPACLCLSSTPSCEGEMFGQIHGRGFGLVIVHPDVHASSSCSCRGETEQSAQLG